MKKLPYIIVLITTICFSQVNEVQRITEIKNRLNKLTSEISGLNEEAKSEINVNNISLSNFILAISNTHKININTATELNNIIVYNNNFSGVKVSELLLFLCKEYQLSLDVTGTILSLKKYIPPKVITHEPAVKVTYNQKENLISIDAKNHKLYDVFKVIMDKTTKNLVFAPNLENKLVTAYIKNLPFDTAMNTFSLSNNLYFKRNSKGFYVFEDDTSTDNTPKNYNRSVKEKYKVLDVEKKLLKVNFNNTSVESIINNLSDDLNLDVFIASPLKQAGVVTFKSKKITFDQLLLKIFELQAVEPPVKQNSRSNNMSHKEQPTKNAHNFTYKKEGNVYYFGTETQLSVRKLEIIHLMHRSVELLTNPTRGNSYSSSSINNNYNTGDNNYNQPYNNNNSNISNNRLSSGNLLNSNSYTGGSETKTIDEIIPKEIVESLEIKVDHELNSLYVTGVSAKIERLKNFIKSIDKTVPVVLIEVMFVEVNKNNKIETGISWSIGDNEQTTKGSLYPKTDVTLGAKTINKVINGFNGFGRLNLGKVVPNFFATVKAMENNGNLKIKSTPRLSTLNGHRATFSNGETSYYTVTQRNIYGTDNPQTSEITNYQPIDAALGITIKPLVSGDGQVTLDIFVIQSSFGNRIDENAPPDISSREFSSIIRVQDQDIVVLGGLEEQIKNDSGEGVPLLSRIPVLKWLFSSRKRESSNAKLTVFIKPTILY